MPKYIPEGYHTLTTYLIVPDAEREISFLRDILGAKVNERFNREDGTLKHGELQIGDSRLMMSQATKEYSGSPVMFYMYVEDVDAVYQLAMGAGAKSLQPVSKMDYGDRSGGFEDPAGNKWYVATHVEEVSAEELERRMGVKAEK
jgi:uncharacterized glyoxalase superfamily protein PhnB